MTEPDDELLVRSSDIARALTLDVFLRSGVLILVGLVTAIRLPVLGVLMAAAGCYVFIEAVAERRRRDLPLAILSRDGVKRRRRYMTPSRFLRWAEIRTVRISRLGIRFEPHEGRALVIDLSSSATNPLDVLAFADRHLPLGSVIDPIGPVGYSESTKATTGPVVLRFRVDRTIGSIFGAVVATGVIGGVIMLLVLDQGRSSVTTLVVVAVVFATLVGATMGLVVLTLRRVRITIDEVGVSAGGLGTRRAYEWARVREVRRTVLPLGRRGLQLGTVDDQRLVLPLSWTDLSEEELIAAMRRLAAPREFEGP